MIPLFYYTFYYTIFYLKCTYPNVNIPQCNYWFYEFQMNLS